MKAVLIMKKTAAVILAFIITFISAAPAYGERALNISAERAVLIHKDGEVIYSKCADEPSLIASTTKLMTGIIVLENCKGNEKLEIKPEYCGIDGSSMYLKPGEIYTVRELLEGLLLVSGNDAATALAMYTAGSEEKFAELMNKKAQELKMENSHFENPHGLDGKEHYSTANDLARLMLYCMKNPDFREITAMGSTKIKEQSFINHNKLLKLCKGCKGGKTGYTMAAGRCLVSCCERAGEEYVCVTLSAPDDWNDHIKLYNYAFSNYETRNLTENLRYSVPLISGERNSVEIKAEEFKLLLPVGTKLSYKAELPFFVFTPVKAGERAGTVKIYADGRLLGEKALYYLKSEPAAAPYKI